MEKRAVSGLLFTLLFLSVLALAFNIEPVSAAVSPYIAVVPDITVDPTLTPGMNYTVSIYTDYDGNDVWGWQFELFFNPAVLEGVEVRNGDLITRDISPRARFYPGDFDNTLGHLYLTLGYFYPLPMPPPTTNGPGTLAYVTFRAKDTGISNITFRSAQLRGFDNVAETFPVIIDQDDPPGATEPPYGRDHIGHSSFDNIPTLTLDTVNIDPDTLNLYSKGQWITAYLQLPEGHNPEDMDATAILLNETIQPVLDPQYDFVTNSSEYLVDHNGDGIFERMIKFNRAEVASWVFDDLGVQYGDVVLSIRGELVDGTPFEGTVAIRVLFPGDVDGDGYVGSADAGVLTRAYGTSSGNPLYVPEADFDEDGYIGSADAGILSGNYGKTAI